MFVRGRAVSNDLPEEVTIRSYKIVHPEITYVDSIYVLIRGTLDVLVYRRKDLIHAPRR